MGSATSSQYPMTICPRSLKNVTCHKLKVRESLTDGYIYDYTGHMDSPDVRDMEVVAEMVVIEYSKSYDLDIAMMKVEVSKEEKELLIKDADFMYRIEYEDATIREDIIKTMVHNMRYDQRNSQKAAIDLGNILYKSKFSKKEEEQKSVVPDTINLVGA